MFSSQDPLESLGIEPVLFVWLAANCEGLRHPRSEVGGLAVEQNQRKGRDDPRAGAEQLDGLPRGAPVWSVARTSSQADLRRYFRLSSLPNIIRSFLLGEESPWVTESQITPSWSTNVGY